MSKEQEIFRRVVKAGHYRISSILGVNTAGMCGALFRANQRLLISDEEYTVAQSAINEYLKKARKFYLHYNLPIGVKRDSQWHYPEVYLNWDFYVSRRTLWDVIKGWFK